MREFINGAKNVMVATSGFGMGIDVPNVRCVIHLAMAPNPEEWVQQIGRAGRDGEQSHVYLLTHPEDHFASFCVNKSSKTHVLQTKRFFLAHYAVNPNRRVGTPGEIYRIMNGIPESEKKRQMGMQELWDWLKFTNSMKILQRYGIIHQAGNSVYFMSKETEHIDWNEVDAIDIKNRSSYHEMCRMMQQKGCIRKSLAAYFGEDYVRPEKFSCCSECKTKSTAL